jgi:phospholipid/cholesterol/gamma-HCH transport system permease protein
MPETVSDRKEIPPRGAFQKARARILDPVLLPLGRLGLGWLDHLGAATIFLIKSLIAIFRRRQLRAVWLQTYYIGARTTTIVALVGLFTGMVLGLQLYYTLVKFGSVGVLGSAVSLTLVRELGPVLTAIMITARAGSAMTAEIGIQRISEQIDALTTMHIDPLGYLISPRIAAALISFPLLTAMFDLIGIVGGYLTGVGLVGGDPGAYIYRVQASVELSDVTGGFVKAFVFAVIVATVCCYQGYFTHLRTDGRGSKSVSLATTSAVVQACVYILVADYIVTSFLL